MHAYLKSLVDPGPARYAWVVDRTLVQNDDCTARVPDTSEFNRDGTTGPHDAPPELLARLAAGEGRQWRTLDEGDEPAAERVTHAGRYLDLDDDGDLGDDAFGPLEDLARPDVGALEIEYLDPDGEWEAL